VFEIMNSEALPSAVGRPISWTPSQEDRLLKRSPRERTRNCRGTAMAGILVSPLKLRDVALRNRIVRADDAYTIPR